MLKACLFFALLWWWLVGWQPASLMVGVPFILLAAYSLTALRESRIASFNWQAAVQFTGYFFLQTLQGTWAVARLVLRNDANRQVGLTFSFPNSLKHDSARLLFINSISLLPGTLVIDFDEERLLIHSVDATNTGEAEIARCENKVAAIFNIARAEAT